jgi:hypothetical protein
MMNQFMLLNVRFRFSFNFKLDNYSLNDFKSMCTLLNQKYLRNNEEINTFKDIKLLDEKGNLIGVYNAAEARKKASSLKKDMVLIN